MFSIRIGKMLCVFSISIAFIVSVFADCECGYQINGTSDIYTELLESDFLHINNITLDTDWIPQVYTVPQALADGPYGKSAELRNVVSNPIPNINNYTAPGRDGGDGGLELFVRSGTLSGGDVPIAELSSSRNDMLYGSYRVAMKLTSVAGTCSAFFWYLNDTAEIDIELLSTPNTTSSDNLYYANLVLQSPASAVVHSASSTPTYDRVPLTFDPTQAFHEYRFDWTPEAVTFYIDSIALATFTGPSVPQSPGHILLSHWSNGNALWSGGPPEGGVDAKTVIGYVKAYFNSSDPARSTSDYEKRCTPFQLVAGMKSAASDQSVCLIPDQRAPLFAPDPPFFFSLQTGAPNMAPNQTVYTDEQQQKKKKNGGVAAPSVVPFFLGMGRSGLLVLWMVAVLAFFAV